jgi:Mlc titration factor MtfA (ptsG expression regulator)
VLKRLHRTWVQHVLCRSRIPYSLWYAYLASAPKPAHLERREQNRLRKLASLFVHGKTITGAAVDPYAAESPAEFFAVLTEVVLEQPERLQQLYPDIYCQLTLYYRQDRLRRLSNH